MMKQSRKSSNFANLLLLVILFNPGKLPVWQNNRKLLFSWSPTAAIVVLVQICIYFIIFFYNGIKHMVLSHEIPILFSLATQKPFIMNEF